MNAKSVFGVALRNLRRAPIRSSLTALGIIVGVASVVITLSIGSGARIRIQETLARPESRTVFLAASVPRAQMSHLGITLAPGDGLNADDYYAIRKSVTDITAVSPRIYVSRFRAQANGREMNVTVEGIDVDGFVTLQRTLLGGTLFSPLDVRNAANVCAVSESLGEFLFPNEQVVGRLLRVGGTTFRVVGMVDDFRGTADSPAGVTDFHVYVPFTSLLRRLDTSARLDVSAQARDIEHVDVVLQRISDVMEQRRSGRKADFTVNAALQSIKAYTDGSLIVARLLAAVGGISLVVGGIGIMNIMLSSVSERTREIGVRMAIGTRSQDILGQFLAEAIALSLVGGTAGVVTGWAISSAITHWNQWPTSIGADAVLISLCCSIVVGVFFGLYPARQAAHMRPVDALRTEN